MKTISSLPEIFKIGICYPKLNKNDEISQSERIKTVNRLISMLDVRFSGDSEEERRQGKALAIAELGTFLKGFNLTGEEVIEAYRMALAKKFDYKVYPNLSLIQAGEILDLFQEFKRNSYLIQSNLEKLRDQFKTPQLEDKFTAQENDLGTMRRIFDEIKSAGFSSTSHVYHRDLLEKGKLRNWNKEQKDRFFDYVKGKLRQEMTKDVKLGKYSSNVAKIALKEEEKMNYQTKIRCQEILVSNYLKKHCESFEEFVKAIKNKESIFF